MASAVEAGAAEGGGSDKERRAAIKAAVKQDGILMKKTDNRMTGAVTMKKRYFALTASQLAYYEVEADMYEADGDALGAISMHQVGGVVGAQRQAGQKGTPPPLPAGPEGAEGRSAGGEQSSDIGMLSSAPLARYLSGGRGEDVVGPEDRHGARL